MNNCFTSCTPLAWLCLLNISWKRQTACFTFQASFLKETLLTIPFLKVWATTYHTEYLRHLKPQKRKLDKCFNSYVCTSNEADHWLCLLIFCKQCMDKRRTMNEEKVGFISYKLYFDGNVGAKNCSFPILFLWGELGIGDLEIPWIKMVCTFLRDSWSAEHPRKVPTFDVLLVVHVFFSIFILILSLGPRSDNLYRWRFYPAMSRPETWQDWRDWRDFSFQNISELYFLKVDTYKET